MTDCEEKKEVRNVGIGTQIYAAFSASFGGIALGTCLSYTSPALPSMIETAFPLMTLDESSWFASLAPLASLIACPLMGYCVDKTGRKGAILLLTLPLLAGWILIGFGKSLPILYGGRFLTGFAGGAYSVGVPIYINEMALESIRGRLGLMMGIGVQIGILYPYIAGYFIPYNWLALSLCFVPISIAVMMFFVAESPRYLLGKGEVKKATEALVWLRQVQDVEEELNLMQKSIDNNSEERLGIRDVLTTPALLRPTCLCLALMFFLVVSGIDAITFFSYTIFKESGTDISPSFSSIAVGTIQLVAMILSAFVIDKLGRRPLLLISEITVVISLAALGLFFYLSKQDTSVKGTLGWLPLASLILFSIAYSIGIGPIPWIYLEIVPTHVAGTATGIAVCFNWFAAFLITRFFETVNHGLGWEWSFWIFGMLSALGGIFVYCCIPETKGKTLEEIQDGFQKR